MIVLDIETSGIDFLKCRLEDSRIVIEDGEIVKKGNALTDAKLTAECFSRIINSKNLLEEFKKFPIPEYLK